MRAADCTYNKTKKFMNDTNTDPSQVSFPIPANDDASKSISKIVEYISDSIQTGLEERKSEKVFSWKQKFLATNN